jgi:tRNA pseudouridine38-40 synthase
LGRAVGEGGGKRGAAVEIAMRSFKLTVAYDGGDFSGWQSQPGKRTVQGELERALTQALGGESIQAIACSRTDAGVHALGQIVSLDTATRLSAERLAMAVNAWLPDDLVVRHIEEMKPGFHALRDTVRKRYRYTIQDGRLRNVITRRQAWHVRCGLNVERMHEAALRLLGTHDFDSFETKGSERLSTRRTIFDIGVERREAMESPQVVLEVEANGFLYNMVRNIAGTLVAVGRGREEPDWVSRVLEARDRRAAGVAAPPQGLCLLRVEIAAGLRLADTAEREE